MATVTELRPSRSDHVRSQELEDERHAFALADATMEDEARIPHRSSELPLGPIERFELAPSWWRSAINILAAAIAVGVLAAVADAYFGFVATFAGRW